MIANILLYSLNEDVNDEAVDQMMRDARSQLLKIQGVLSVRSGKRVRESNPYEFFLSLEFESLNKMEICKDDPVFIKFIETVIRPNSVSEDSYSYELEPGKNIKYS